MRLSGSRLERALGRRGIGLLLLLLALPIGLTLILRGTPTLDLVFESATFHVLVVSGIALSALVVALVTTVAAARDGRPETVLVAVGCVVVGALMLAHGLTTPGVADRPMNLWVARLPTLALAGFALCLLAATPNHSTPVIRFVARFPRRTLAVSVGVVTFFAAAVSADPTLAWGTHAFPWEPTASTVLAVGSGVALLAAGSRHWRRWRLGRDRVELSLVMACWLSADAVVSLELGQLWRISWWDYHAYLLGGFAAAAWAVLVGLRREGSARVVESISLRDPLDHIARGSPEAFHALTAAVEAKDPYTHGHSARVARISVGLADRLGLGPDTLRPLAQGAQLHDIGKIGVPDAVLNKPSRLSDDEWEWIQAHPVVGWEIASRAPSLRDVLDVVRYHHERWDGSGYPDGRTAEEIPLMARIAAVADVWDALTSDRAYRPAWPADQALSHIAAASGSLFDPTCVLAFVDLLSDERVWPEPIGLDREALDAAAESCHRAAAGDASRHRAG